NPAKALEQLEPAARYEGGGFETIYTRGLAHLQAHSGKDAAGEFEKILARRGVAPVSILYPLSYLGLGRAQALAGDAAKARKAYQDFFAVWKDADPDLAPLRQARAEYDRLK